MSDAAQDENDEVARSRSDEPPRGSLADLASVTPETFAPCVGDTFRVRNCSVESTETHVFPRGDRLPGRSDEIVELTLVEVTRYPRIEEREGGFEHRPREPFALLFEGPADCILMGAILSVSHKQLGTGQLLFTPVQVSLKPDVKRSSKFYEVVFG